MTQRMIIEASGHTLEAELLDTPAAKTICSSLPLSAQMSRWGEEYYGSVGIEIRDDGTGRDLVEVGEVAYWPPGKALCIFFGLARLPVLMTARKPHHRFCPSGA